MVRSSPRASAGLSRLAASPVPAAPPAPIRVCASSMKRMIGVSEDWTSSMTACRRFSNSPFTPAPACSRPRSSMRRLTFCSVGGTSPCGDAEGEALDDGGLADAGLAGEDRVVLPAAHQDVDDLADLGVAADDRVDLAGAGALGEVGGVFARGPTRRRGRGAARARRRARAAAAGAAFDRAGEDVVEARAERVGVDLVELGADLGDEAFEDGDPEGAEEDVGGADGLVAELQRAVAPALPGWRGRRGRRSPGSRWRRRAAGRGRRSCRRRGARGRRRLRRGGAGRRRGRSAPAAR